DRSRPRRAPRADTPGGVVMTVWALCFTATCLVEIITVWLVAAKLRIPLPHLVALVVFANVLTHPLAYLWLATTEEAGTQLAELLVCELLLIPVTEGLVYWWAGKTSLRRAIGLSYVANAASLLFGLVAALFTM